VTHGECSKEREWLAERELTRALGQRGGGQVARQGERADPHQREPGAGGARAWAEGEKYASRDPVKSTGNHHTRGWLPRGWGAPDDERDVDSSRTSARLPAAVVRHVTAVRLPVERTKWLHSWSSASSTVWPKQILVRARPVPLACLPCLEPRQRLRYGSPSIGADACRSRPFR
jgi:hypothetical protein